MFHSLPTQLFSIQISELSAVRRYATSAFCTKDVYKRQKPLRRYELLGGISLLSPEYLLSFERCPFHAETPDHYALVSYLLDLFCLLYTSDAGVKVEIPKPSITNGPFTFFICRMLYTFSGCYEMKLRLQLINMSTFFRWL